jgi:glycosyltransferase involved in cell wall biosynthesis
VNVRVLHVMEATIGGTKRHLLDLATGLRAAGWDVEVACPRVRDEALGDVSFWADLQDARIPAHEVPMRRRPVNPENARAIARLSLLIRRGHYGIVHAHSSIAGALARPAALLSGRRPKLVYTPHGFAFLAAGRRGRQVAFRTVERALGRVTDRLIAVSSTEAAAAAQHGVIPASRVQVIPNGVISSQVPQDRDGVRRKVRRREGWGDVPVVGTVARMTPQKDPITWLRVAAQVAAVRPEVRFVWVWGGESAAEVHQEARRLGLGDRLSILGYRPDARDLIAAMDVFLLTSVFEGLPYTVIEALASGTPAVATDVVGTRDVVRHGETGLLAPAGDVPALAQAVLHCLERSEESRRRSADGKQDVLARFSVAAMVRQTAALYRDLTVENSRDQTALHLPQMAR